MTTKKKPANTSEERQGRVAQSRHMEMRDADIREMLKMSFADPLHINPDSIPEGMEYFWARDSFAGEIDTARMTQVQKRGWTAVRAEDRKDLQNAQFAGRESPLSNYIHYKGLILCERPARFGQIESQMEREQAHESMITLPVHQDLDSVTGWKSKVYENQTAVMKSKTSSFKE